MTNKPKPFRYEIKAPNGTTVATKEIYGVHIVYNQNKVWLKK